jgi:hypothetical protein
MDTMAAFAMAKANANNPRKVFDWNKAAELIRDRRPEVASAGLSGDWEYTGGTIYQNGAPDNDSYTYLASVWATPELDLDGDVVPCFVMEDAVPAEWGDDFAGIKWPKSALAILEAEAK